MVARLGVGSSAQKCHARFSTASVTEAIVAAEDDVVSADLAFLNVHYAAAAATGLARGRAAATGTKAATTPTGSRTWSVSTPAPAATIRMR